MLYKCKGASGKSKLLECFKDYILKNLVDVNIININFNMNKFEDLKKYHALGSLIEMLTFMVKRIL